MATKVRQLAEATPNSSHPNPLISHDKLRQLYSMMLKCRLLDQRARMLRMQAGFEDDRYSSVGLEATAVGAAIDLRPTDTVGPSYRDFMLGYLKGMPLTIIFAQFYGHNSRASTGRVPHGDSQYSRLNIVLPTSTVAAQLNRCTDIALANQRAKNDHVVMAFLDEDSISLGERHHALNFSGQQRLPIVFVRHASNLSARSASVNIGSTGNGPSPEAVEYGFPTIAVDSSDAVAVYRVAQEAVERARCGGGATLIEAETISGYEPTEMDRSHYQAADEVEESKSSDSIAAMERYLAGKDLFSEGWKKEIAAAFQEELEAAVDAVENDSCGVSA